MVISSPARRLRVLCLHGMRTNAAVMKAQTKDLQAALSDRADFIYLNGMYEAQGPSDDVVERVFAKDKPFYEWVLARKLNADDREFSPDEKQWTWKYDGLDEAVEYIDTKLNEIGPVDVVVGFSQGAIVLSHLSMLYLQRENPVRWWDLCVCVSGTAVRGVNVRSQFETPSGEKIRVPFPSIHIAGEKDFVYKESLRLADQFEDHPATASAGLSKRILVHDGGHRFPAAEKNPGLYDEIAQLILGHFSDKETPVASGP